jgi:hypothetical protein
MYRLSKNTEDPLASICFDPPADSAELHDALARIYPECATHEARIRDAIINYLIEERSNEAVSGGWCTLKSGLNSTQPDGDNKSINSDSTLQPRGSAPKEASKRIETKTELDSKSTIHTISTTTEAEKNSSHKWKSMTSVWNPFNRKLSKRGRSTPMTAEEKAEYRKIRKQGACGDCKKRKRKCSDDHYNAQANRSTASLTSDRPRNRRKADNEPPLESLPPTDEISPGEPLPILDLGTNFGNDEAFYDFLVHHPEFVFNDPAFYLPSEVVPPDGGPSRSLRHKSSNLSQLSGSETSMFAMSLTTASTAPSIYEVLFQDESAWGASSTVPPPIPANFADLFEEIGITQEPAEPKKPEPEIPNELAETAWLGAWDQLFDVSLDEARSSLEGLAMGHDAV